MKAKILNGLLIVTSLFGYLEWGGNNHIFLIQAEVEIITKLITAPKSVMHPFVLLPLIGQVLLTITLLQKTPHQWLSYIGSACLGILLIFMFIIGIMSLNFKIICSTIPFLVILCYTFIYLKKASK
jgi:hypothetical protein